MYFSGILGFVCSANCLGSPATFGMLSQVSGRLCILFINITTDNSSTATCTTLEAMCSSAINFNNARFGLKEAINWHTPILHQMVFDMSVNYTGQSQDFTYLTHLQWFPVHPPCQNSFHHSPQWHPCWSCLWLCCY